MKIPEAHERRPVITIHDPIHGSIELTSREIRIVDSRPFQRLRHIRQLGLGELAFPGATHTRYAHSLGAMQVATCMADRILRDLDLDIADRRRLRQTVRLAVLLHDIGHAPLSHTSERVMPPLRDLGLPSAWTKGADRRATHEDFTLKLLIDSELTDAIRQLFADDGITAESLAALVVGEMEPGDDTFVVGGRNLFPLLRQMVSSELDADRMDYLRRDAYYCGVSYGTFDHLWLTENLLAVDGDGHIAMALRHKAVWAFESFLLARYHMFLAVYYHHSPVCFDYLLGRYFQCGEYSLPADSEGYLETDDIQLQSTLRGSRNPWAQRVVRRQAYRLLVERHDYGNDSRDGTDEVEQRLQQADIDFFRVRSRGVLSKYFKQRERVFPLWVVEPEMGRVRRIEDYTPLYQRFDEVVGLARLYCHPDHLERARQILADSCSP